MKIYKDKMEYEFFDKNPYGYSSYAIYADSEDATHYWALEVSRNKINLKLYKYYKGQPRSKFSYNEVDPSLKNYVAI